MLDNWLKRIDPKLLKKFNLGKEKFGARIQRYESNLPNLKAASIAIIGIGEQEANAVREQLYPMSFPFGGLQVADLGNVRREENDFMMPAIKELLEGHVCPVIIGREGAFINAQFDAHHNYQPSVSLAVVDERAAFHPGQNEPGSLYLGSILENKARLFHFTAIGCQSHFMDDAVLQELEKKDFECIRLGKARANLAEVEPYIRDADMVGFHLGALKRIEAPGVAKASPSGFFSEEACQISRYAGMSDKLTSMGFYGFEKKMDPAGHTAQTLAQLVWYFLDGFSNRKNDFPASMDGLMEYIVDFKGHDYQLTFWKSNKTGRWWMQVPVKTKKKHQRHRLIPCSYNDYLLASKEELPERLLHAYRRFD